MIFPLLLAQTQAAPPNIVLIVADDAGYADFGFMGSNEIKTPNLDKLADDGVVFEDAYVTSPVCSPSRAGLFTGRYQQSFGHEYNILPPDSRIDPDIWGMDVTVPTIADYFSDLNYECGYIGKWHLGAEDHFYPTARGWDEFYGFRGGSRDYFKVESGARKLESNYRTPDKPTYLTTDFGNEAVDYIKRHKNDQFFLTISFNAPHSPMQALEADLAQFEDLKPNVRKRYAAMMLSMDRQIGAVIDELKNQELYENSVVIFISDNGGPTSYNGSLNAPLFGQKATMFEGGVRVPMVLARPGHFEGGQRVQAPVSALDIAPTLLNMAGYEQHPDTSYAVSDLHGVDINEALNELETMSDRSLFWRLGEMAAVRSGSWKLLRTADRPPQLFDLSADVSEQRDMALLRPGIVKRLMADLWQWETALSRPDWITSVGWMRGKLRLYDLEYRLDQPNRN